MDVVFSQAKGPLDVVRVARTLPVTETLDVHGSNDAAKNGVTKDDEVA